MRVVVLCHPDNEKNLDLPDMLLAQGVVFERFKNEVYCYVPSAMVQICSKREGPFVVIATEPCPDVNRALLRDSKTTYNYKGLWVYDGAVLTKQWADPMVLPKTLEEE